MISFLTLSYPFKQSRHLLRDSIAYGVLIWAILYFLQPFGFSLYSGSKCLAAALFGLITTCCYALYGWTVLRTLTRRVRPWRIWHEGCAVLGLILFIAVCNVLLFAYIFHYPITLEYNRSLRERMEELLSNTTEQQKDIMITLHDTNVRGNNLTIPINSLLYIEAQKNNISVCYLKENDGEQPSAHPVRVEIHTTLTAAIEELKDYENIFQCHRSFVVNVNNITSAKGNSNGYQLTLGQCSDTIPVSRSYVPRLKSFIA